MAVPDVLNKHIGIKAEHEKRERSTEVPASNYGVHLTLLTLTIDKMEKPSISQFITRSKSIIEGNEQLFIAEEDFSFMELLIQKDSLDIMMEKL